MPRALHIAGVLLLAAQFWWGLGPTAANADRRQDVQRDIETTRKSIADGQYRQRALGNQARAIRDQVDGLRIRAAVTAHQAQQQETALNGIEGRLVLLRRQDADHRRRLGQMRHGMARSITALARLERQPAAALMASPGTMLDAARGGRLLAAAVPALHRDAAAVGALLLAAGKARHQLGQEQQRRLAAVATLNGRRQELQALLRERAAFEKQLQQAGKAEGKRLAMLASRARDLQGLMRRLDLAAQRREDRQDRQDRNLAEDAAGRDNTPQETPAEQRDRHHRQRLAAGIARALASGQRGRGNGDKTGSSPDGSAQRPAPPTAPSTAPAEKRLAMAPGPLPFSKIRGRLRLPAKGERVGRYGESTGFGPRAQGITLQTREGAQVVAPYDGRVVFAGTFRDYGLILIISHGEGYHTLLAGLSQLQAVVGQSLLTGEPVGHMGGDGKQSLYIELRRKGTAINPNPWWSSSHERASG
ncbi:MAG: peptidoglycan DD-metalloendopeptidase family protein [Alphaproteobacteria bacterium]|nr:peptidoglycan DD-metalloendopeptidase family protein [Alphaproteobacteria bacterium]